MQVTEVRIKLMEGSEDRLRAFCSITLDHSFVIRDLKVIDGASGPFVAMPSRKLSGHCYRCNYKNHLRAAYCNQCGTKLKVVVPPDSPQKLYADVAHPVNSDCREMISIAVLAEFEAELTRAAQPGYRSRYDDDFDAISESHDDLFPVGSTSQRAPQQDPQRDTVGNEIRIDNSHDAPHRSSTDPPSAAPRTVDRNPNPSGSVGSTPFQTASQMPMPPKPASSERSGGSSVADKNAGSPIRSNGLRVDSPEPTVQNRAALQPSTEQSSPQAHVYRQPGTRPDRSIESQIPKSEDGFGAGIFD